MAGHPMNVQEVGRLIDLGVVDLTDSAVSVSAGSRTVMAVSIQAETDNAVDVLVGDSIQQSRRLAARDVYLVQVGDAANVYMRADGIGATAQVNIHILLPPGGR